MTETTTPDAYMSRNIRRMHKEEQLKKVKTDPALLIKAHGEEEELMVDKIIQQAENRERAESEKNTHDELIVGESEQEAMHLSENIQKLFEFTHYDIGDILARAEKNNIHTLKLIEGLTKETLSEYHSAKLKLQHNALDTKTTDDNQEIDIIIKSVLNKTLRAHDAFIDPPLGEKEKILKEKIRTLPDALRIQLEKQWDSHFDSFLQKTETNFRKHLEPIVRERVIALYHDTMPGLLRITQDHDTRVEQNDTKPTQKKYNKAISGFFKRLFT